MAEADRLYPGDVVAAQVGPDLWGGTILYKVGPPR